MILVAMASHRPLLGWGIQGTLSWGGDSWLPPALSALESCPVPWILLFWSVLELTKHFACSPLTHHLLPYMSLASVRVPLKQGPLVSQLQHPNQVRD